MIKRIYDKEQFSVGKWSGGVTSEFAIYPENSNYIERDFIWRLSSAKVEIEESTFTKLPEYERILMVLNGEAILVHGDERTVKLNEGQQDSFDGEIKTKCFGCIEDYNLMYKKGCQGRLKIHLLEESSKNIEFSSSEKFSHVSYGIYCLSGYAVISVDGETTMVQSGKQMVIDAEKDEISSIALMGEGKAIVAEIYYTRNELLPEIIPEEPATFTDFVEAFKLVHGRHKWIFLSKKKKHIWYDEELKKKLNFIDKTYMGIIIWTVVSVILVCLGVKGISHTTIIGLIALWTVVYGVIIAPLIYLVILPKPIKAHIKNVNSLTEYERGLYEKELQKNEMTDKILNKYKYSGKENFDKDYESIFSRIKK